MSYLFSHRAANAKQISQDRRKDMGNKDIILIRHMEMIHEKQGTFKENWKQNGPRMRKIKF